jgi:hypothetical protein
LVSCSRWKVVVAGGFVRFLGLLLEAALQIGLQRPKAVLESGLIGRADNSGLHQVAARRGVEPVEDGQAVALHADQLRELLGWGQLPARWAVDGEAIHGKGLAAPVARMVRRVGSMS